jgi:hypothetical protein
VIYLEARCIYPGLNGYELRWDTNSLEEAASGSNNQNAHILHFISRADGIGQMRQASGLALAYNQPCLPGCQPLSPIVLCVTFDG